MKKLLLLAAFFFMLSSASVSSQIYIYNETNVTYTVDLDAHYMPLSITGMPVIPTYTNETRTIYPKSRGSFYFIFTQIYYMNFTFYSPTGNSQTYEMAYDDLAIGQSVTVSWSPRPPMPGFPWESPWMHKITRVGQCSYEISEGWW